MSQKLQVTYEATPNPQSMKFIIGQTIASENVFISSIEEARRSPLAQKLFGFPWMQAILIGPYFVTITKQDWVDWKVLANPLSGLLAEHVNSGQAVFLDLPKSADESENDSEIVKQIKRVLNTEIKPVVNLDGGDIAFVKLENDNLYLQLKGACSSCPSSQATLKDGIEVRIKQVFPTIKEVLAI